MNSLLASGLKASPPGHELLAGGIEVAGSDRGRVADREDEDVLVVGGVGAGGEVGPVAAGGDGDRVGPGRIGARERQVGGEEGLDYLGSARGREHVERVRAEREVAEVAGASRVPDALTANGTAAALPNAKAAPTYADERWRVGASAAG
jgi:hypothetical protein